MIDDSVVLDFKKKFPYLWRKIDILCHGINRDMEGVLDELYALQNPLDTQRTGNVGLQAKIYEKKLALNIAVYKDFCKSSPYQLRYDSNNRLAIYNNIDDSYIEVCCSSCPPNWYRQKLSNGHFVGEFILLEGEYTAIASISKGCIYFNHGTQCKFCAIGPEEMSDCEVSSHEHRESVLESLKYVVKDDSVKNIHLTGGNTYSIDRGAKGYYPFVEKICCLNSKKQVAVEIPPPSMDVQLEIFEHLKYLGADSITMNIELWDDDWRREIMPEKGRISKDEYIAAYKTALEVFGKNKVTCGFIVGIEPINNTKLGIDVLSSIGVITEVYPFKPNKGSLMDSHAITSTNDIISVSLYASRLMNRYNINPAMCSGCVKCGACGLTQQLFEYNIFG